MCFTFLETLGKVQFNDNDSSHHDPHQEGQDDQKYPPSSRRFLMVIFPLREGGARAITGARAGARAISETRPDLGPGPNFYKDFILCLEKCSTQNSSNVIDCPGPGLGLGLGPRLELGPDIGPQLGWGPRLGMGPGLRLKPEPGLGPGLSLGLG